MSSVCLFLLIVTALLLTIKKCIKSYITILTVTIIYFVLIASGIIPSLLLKQLQASFISTTSPHWKKNNIIILLGGDGTTLPQTHTIIPPTLVFSRIFKTAELYLSCKKQSQCRILISGGMINHTQISEALVYERALMSLGIDHDDFILETNSTNTHENALFTSEILKQENFDQAVLVTSGIHLKRALLWFQYVGIHAIPISSDYSQPYVSIMSLGDNFALTDFALHEYFGIIQFYLEQLLAEEKRKQAPTRSLISMNH